LALPKREVLAEPPGDSEVLAEPLKGQVMRKLEGIDTSYPDNRLYRIANDPRYGIGAGIGPDRQVLIAGKVAGVLAVVFDLQGAMTDISFTPSQPGDHRRTLVAELQRSMQIQPGTIAVRKFFLPHYYVGITDLPSQLQEFVDNPDDSPEYDASLQDLADWLAAGYYVLVWNEQYYLNRDGKVISS
jgi:hypothetical protein